MLLSYGWLKDFIEITETPQELAAIFTKLGFEASVREVNSGWSGIVVGKVVSKTPHSGSDKLSLCEVFDGKNTLKVVCGAPNVAAGQIVPLAVVGAMAGELEIKKTKIRGAESEGMICSEKELGISDSSAGIMVLASDAVCGSDFSSVYPRDWVIEIESLPNRPDMLSHYGAAQELSAKLGRTLKPPKIYSEKIPSDGSFAEITPSASAACESYEALFLDGVAVGQSPEWLKNRLYMCGYRPINAVVDVTNYVLAELGHPLHAFDRDTIVGGKLAVRRAAASEKIKALDEKDYTLAGDDLVIADSSGVAAIAGVIGGARTAVSFSTTKIILESAVFEPKGIFSTRRRLKISTESSYRFERGMNKPRSEFALLRAAALLGRLSSARVVSSCDYGAGPEHKKIPVFYGKIRSHTGVDIPDAKVRSILSALSFDILRDEKDFVVVSPPAFRRDVSRSEDVIEEIIRIYGYDNVPLSDAFAAPPLSAPSPARRAFDFTSVARKILASSGFVENVDYGMVSSRWFDFFDEKKCAKIINPVSPDMTVLRPSLFCEMWNNLCANRNDGFDSQLCFETGAVFYDGEQTDSFGLIAVGNTLGDNWKKARLDADFYFLKGIIEKLAAASSLKISFSTPAAKPVPGGPRDFLTHRITIAAGSRPVGFAGPVAPSLALEDGVNVPVWWAEFDLSPFAENPRAVPAFSAYSQFPPSTLDFSFVVPSSVSYEKIEASVLSVPLSSGQTIESVFPTDVWRPSSQENEASVTIRVILRHPERTLSAQDISDSHARIVKHAEASLGLKLRA